MPIMTRQAHSRSAETSHGFTGRIILSQFEPNGRASMRYHLSQSRTVSYGSDGPLQIDS